MTSSATSTHGLLLYDFDGSPCARRVRITLVEKGLDWDTQVVDLSRLEQRSARYLAVNPNGLVPTLAHGGRVLWESNVITEYLDDVFPAPRLYPLDPRERATVKGWQAAELSMAKDYRPLMYQRLLGPVLHVSRTLDEALGIARRSTKEEADLEWERRVWSMTVLTPSEQAGAEARLLAFLQRVESALERGDWLVGDAFSQAEISVYPRLAMYPHIGLAIDDSRWPRTTRWMRRLESRESFAATRSRQEAALARLASSPVFAFLRRTLARPASTRRLHERAALAFLGAMIRRETDRREARAAADRTWKTPADGAEPPPSRLLRERSPWRARRVTLATGDRGPEERRLLATLAERGIDWERDDASAPGTLAVDGLAIDDVQLAAELLDDVVLEGCRAQQGTRLFPDEAWEAAEVRLWLAFDAAMHKEFRPLHERRVLGRDDVRFDTSEASALSILESRLDVLEERLRSRGWIAAGRFTAADLALALRVESFAAFGLDAVDGRPSLARWMHAVLSRPALRGA